MEVHRKPVEVPNMIGTEIRMKSIVEQSIIHREINRTAPSAAGGARVGSRGTLAGRLGLLQREGEWGSRIRREIVRGKIKTICFILSVVGSPPQPVEHAGHLASARFWDQNNNTRTLNVLNDLAVASLACSHGNVKLVMIA